MIPTLVFGLFTTGVLAFGIISIILELKWSPLMIATVMGIGLIMIV